MNIIMHIDKHAPYIELLADRILSCPGVTEPALRIQLKEYGEALFSNQQATINHNLPAPLLHYLEKVALSAYKVTDTDIQQLRELGYSEDAIFEMTLSVALGVSMFTLEQGLSVVRSNRA